ncbi:cytochrome c oxidase assembly factor CtaG [Salirhabdus sp. Marseille-P4669]|uniref:cytochrome c oxidase assembly factor CtaG n=1 Tax=Salirhabdus sp. Marseille-P4669 TaxID=2042310 RepID=UPI000C7E3B88|nr:cytochrome c oxidase assembly factor CtaG [Salirhabdus sp. Marseille-P4669]
MWTKLQIFGFRALWSPYFLLFVIALSLLYYLITGPLRHKFGGSNQSVPTGKQQFSFYLGMLTLYLVKGAPVDLLSHISLLAHMIQMALFYLLFPILIIRGIPGWIWRKVFNIKVLKPILNLFTKPLIAIFLFNFLFSIYHLPDILDFSKTSATAHSIISIVILFAAFCMWWPLITPLEEQQRIKPLFKIFYIFANGVLITPACGLIIFAPESLYETYSNMEAWSNALSLCVPFDVLSGLNTTAFNGPEFFTDMSLLHDQQAGGILMKVMQEIIYGIVLGKVFFSWYRKENRDIDPIPNQS